MAEGGYVHAFVFCLSGGLEDLITKSDVPRQLKLVVLQLSHVMRISHQKTSAVQMSRWSGFEYCSLLPRLEQ